MSWVYVQEFSVCLLRSSNSSTRAAYIIPGSQEAVNGIYPPMYGVKSRHPCMTSKAATHVWHQRPPPMYGMSLRAATHVWHQGPPPMYGIKSRHLSGQLHQVPIKRCLSYQDEVHSLEPIIILLEKGQLPNPSLC